MTTLNRVAARVITSLLPGLDKFTYGVHALTDVTGFGLIGHARELAAASGVSLLLHAGAVAALPGALDCIAAGNIPGGLKANRDFAECVVSYEGEISDAQKTLLFDPQTAGGLLASVAQNHAGELLHALREAGIAAVEIGEVSKQGNSLITVTQ
ncbi:MAG: hypothetical protein H0X25_06495 [Acidobacteriales bacterium]|nr:hypothetical protein [Terriglobales bacterium]